MSISREPDSIVIEDDGGRVMGIHVKKDGQVMFSRPCGKPGVVTRLIELDRIDARKLANELLDILGRYDQ